jgi:hypothetical protein
MDIVIMILFVVGLTLVSVSWLRDDLKCPAPKVIYKYVPKHTLDVQFGDENNPSAIFKDMFTKGAPWIGGYELGNGKTYTQVQVPTAESK